MLQSIAVLAADIKLSHTLFALPFALLAMVLSAGYANRWPSVTEVGLILLCMILARTAAMTANRFLDADLDAQNPRTAKRAIPSGRLSKTAAMVAMLVTSLGFVAGAAVFWLLRNNPWPLLACPLVLAWLMGYSLTKRYTWLCHLWLGAALALSPLAAALAIEPTWLQTAAPYFLALMVTGWVTGFDILYALQDVEIDRKLKLYSIPARLGVGRALMVSRLLHGISLAALMAFYLACPMLKTGFAVGLALVAGLLILEHALIARSAKRHLNMAFFTLNGVISLLLGLLGIFDRWGPG